MVSFYTKVLISFLVILIVVISLGITLTYHFIIGVKWNYKTCLDTFDRDTCDVLIPPLKFYRV